MNALTADALVTSSDRLSLTLCLAILLHAILILGVSFVPPINNLPNYETMEVVLVNSRSEEKPEDPQLLAQANQLGGGDEDQDVRPATPVTTPVPAAVAAVPIAPTPALMPELPSPTVAPQPEEPYPVPDAPTAPPAAATQMPDAQTPATQELVAQAVDELDRQLNNTSLTDRNAPEEEKSADKPPNPKLEMAQDGDAVTPPATPAPSGAALIARSFEIASLDAEIAERIEAKNKRPRRKFISATTADYKYAAYMEAWRAKVERIGNLNYQDEARRNRLSGSLILDVALNSDGSLNEITVRRPSGFPVLDDAAIRIVKLAAPYAVFPDEFKKDIDILHITRTWQFKSGARFASQ